MKAKIYINEKFVIGEIDKRLYSSFIEHMGRAVYEGIYDPGNRLSTKEGYRLDVIEAVEELAVPMIRYPGGNFVSGYRWEDGIGPREERPRKLDLAWKSIESNQFGTDEFMAWVKKVSAEAMMAVNLGTRGIQEACDLVEYCNLSTNTYWANKRVQNGQSDPYKIRTWCLGNEMDGPWQIGHKTATDYGKLANETAKSMKIVDPSIEVVACGSSNESIATFGYWEREVLAECYENVDYISMHQYYDKPVKGTMHHVAKSLLMDRFISSVVAICDEMRAIKRSDKVMNISFDEWNVWYHSNEQDEQQASWQEAPHLLEDHYTFEDALLVGLSLITLIKHADRVKIACYAQLVNVIAPIMTTEAGLFKQTIFYPILHAANYGQGEALQTIVEVPTYQVADFGNVPYVEAVAIKQENEQYTIFAVNRNLEEISECAIFLNGSEQDYEIDKHISYTSSDPHAKNSMEKSIQPVEKKCEEKLRLEPFSWNVIQLRKKGN